MQIFNQYLDRFPPPEQQEIQRLLQQYDSAATPQDQALLQRRLEPFSRRIMQMASVDRQIGNPYLSQTNLNIENKYPGGPPPALPDDPIETMNLNRPPVQIPTMIERQIQEYQNREPVPPPSRPVSVRPSSPAVQSRQIVGPSQLPTTARANTAVQMPARPKTPAVPTQSAPAQGGGLLDVDMDFFDDPTRMGLLQAGLGLLSAPRYSTNPNDVTLSSALARGLGGFIQGYGGTRQRLSEEERQKLEDEYQRSVRDFNQRYMQTQMDATQRRLDNEDETITQKVLRQQEAEKEKQAIIADILTAEPDATATRKSALNRMTLEELNAERAVYFPSAETLQQQEKEKQARERLAGLTGQPAEMFEGQSLDKLNAEILKQSVPPDPKAKPRGSQAERDEDTLINATAEQANDPKVQGAFQRLFLEPSDETTQWNPQKQQTERFKTYPMIPSYYAEKFPALAQQQEQLKKQSSVVPAKPNLTEQQQRARGDVLAGFEQEIIDNNYDEPMDTYSFDEAMPFRRFQSDEYVMKIDAQDRWIENVLRAASGAAINVGEYAKYRTMYFPTPGEGTEAKERKRQMRALKVREAQLKIAEQARIQGALPQVSEDPDDILLQ